MVYKKNVQTLWIHFYISFATSTVKNIDIINQAKFDNDQTIIYAQKCKYDIFDIMKDTP